MALGVTDDSEGFEKELERRSTEELISILRNRDDEEWRPEVFDVVAAILSARGVSPDQVTAMGPEASDVIESAPTVTIATFFSPAEAHTSRMALDEAGIPAWVADEAGGTMYGVGIGARLQVRVSDEAAAREVLASPPAPADALPPEGAEPACPACGSRNVASQAWVEKEETGPRGAGTDRRWYYVCSDCHEAWPA